MNREQKINLQCNLIEQLQEFYEDPEKQREDPEKQRAFEKWKAERRKTKDV